MNRLGNLNDIEVEFDNDFVQVEHAFRGNLKTLIHAHY